MGESRHIGVRIICDSHNISSPCRDIYEEKNRCEAAEIKEKCLILQKITAHMNVVCYIFLIFAAWRRIRHRHDIGSFCMGVLYTKDSLLFYYLPYKILTT